jgi:hypothetical protein
MINETQYQLLMNAIKIDQKYIEETIEKQRKEIESIVSYHVRNDKTLRQSDVESEIAYYALQEEVETEYDKYHDKPAPIETTKCLEVARVNPNVIGNSGTNAMQYILQEESKNPTMGNAMIIETLLKYGADPSQKCRYQGNDIPIIHQFILMNNDRSIQATLELFNTLLDYTSNVNVTDNWGRNIGHLLYDIYNSSKYTTYILENVIGTTIINLDHKALIDDQDKVTLAKIRGTLPKSYGKSVQELIVENRV